MPPRKASARRNKSSSTSATTAVDAHESPAPKPKSEAELPKNLNVKETVPEILVQEEVSDPNRAEIEVIGVGVGASSKSMNKEEARDENGVVDSIGEGKQVVEEETKTIQEKEDEEPDEDEEVEEEEEPEEEEDGSQLEQNAEINSAQEEVTAVQVDDSKILNDNNNDVQDSDISKSVCKTNDALVGNNEDVKGTTDIASIQESAQTSHENETTLAVEDDSMEDMYDDESDDDSEGDDDADNVNGEDQDPSLIVQDSSPDNKKDKGTELYVGKLDKNAVEEDLVNIFQQFGELKSTRVVRRPDTNKSKGFAFVRFASVDQAKRALSELKDGVEVRGKRVVISTSQDNDTLYLGNICKTWTKEQVLQQLKEYGIEHIVVLRVPEDTKIDRKNKGFAFLEFSTHSNAVEAFKRLKKPDVFFGRDTSAKVAFAETPKHSSDEDLSQVNKVHLEGVTKDWTEEKVKDICKKYGEILKINLRPGTRGKRRDFGFVTFSCSESALACVEGINNTATGGEAKIKASIAKSQQKQGFHGGYRVEKQSDNSNKKSQSKSSKMKAQQTKTNKKFPSKNKMKDNTVNPQQKGPLKKDGESSKEANDSQHGKRKRKASSEQKLNARDLGTPKKPRNGGQGQNSQAASKAVGHKRKKGSGNEVEDRGNRNAQGKKPFKKQKGNMHGRVRDNSRKPKRDAHNRRGHNDYRNSTRYNPYAPEYAASASNAYHVASDHSLSTRRYKEMEPHAGYIEPHAVRASHGQHQAVYLGPASTGQSQLYPRYLDRPVITQSHGGYIETAGAQHYRDYRSSATVQVARGPYDSGLARVRQDDRGTGAGGITYVGGPALPASQVPGHTNYYQAGGSYGGAYGTRGGYY